MQKCIWFFVQFCQFFLSFFPHRTSNYMIAESFSSFGRNPHFQMLAVMVLSQHRVSTSKTVSPRIPVGARCTGHVRMMCSAVCSAAPHLQFHVGARPHLCMNDWKHPTPAQKRLSLTHDDLGRPIPIGLVLVLGMKARRSDEHSEYSVLHLKSVH